MNFKQMLDNIDDALSEVSFQAISLLICIAIVALTTFVAIIVGLLAYPKATVPVVATAIIGRIIYAALKGK